jgi:hypothetical protein
MPAHNPDVRRATAKLAAAQRWHRGKETAELTRDLAAERLADHIQRVVNSAPPLTAEQRDRLASLLRGGDAA